MEILLLILYRPYIQYMRSRMGQTQRPIAGTTILSLLQGNNARAGNESNKSRIAPESTDPHSLHKGMQGQESGVVAELGQA